MMIHEIQLKWFNVIITLAFSVATAQAVTIETVLVGNLGNVADDTGFGAVDYDYSIGKYEVTAGQYCEFLNAVAGIDAYGLYNWSMWSDVYGCKIERFDGSGTTADPYQYRVAADWQNRPVNYVSWGDAIRFANWIHNGQPTGVQDLTTTEDGAYYVNGAISDTDLKCVDRKAEWKWAITNTNEFYKAAYHKNDGATGNYFDYPTSSNHEPGYINDNGNMSGTGTAFTEGGIDPGNYATYNGDGGVTGLGSPYYLTNVGEWENSYSPYGTFDQGGNVWEWTGPFNPLWGGSAFEENSYSMETSGMLFGIAYLTNEDGGLGFRLVQVPEPGSIILFFCGLLAGLVWWMRRV